MCSGSFLSAKLGLVLSERVIDERRTHVPVQARQREREQAKKERLLLGKPHGNSNSLKAPAAAQPALPLPQASSSGSVGGGGGTEGPAEAGEQLLSRGDRFLAAHFQRPALQQRSSKALGRPPPSRTISPRCALPHAFYSVTLTCGGLACAIPCRLRVWYMRQGSTEGRE